MSTMTVAAYSLKISPNLEKALEFEEQMRQRRAGSPGQERREVTQVGLPPPPRRRRKSGGQRRIPQQQQQQGALNSSEWAEDGMRRNPFVRDAATLLSPRAAAHPEDRMSSSSSSGSCSSVLPASTVDDRRYSISSTVHMPSSEDHENVFFYDCPRNSFIDFSPTGTTFASALPPAPPSKPPSPPQQMPQKILPSPRARPAPLPVTVPSSREAIPPTTNFLNPEERADLIRKSQKLAKVFGKSLGAQELHGIASSRQDVYSEQNHRYPRPPLNQAQYLVTSARRHSTPLTPDEFSFLNTHIQSTTANKHASTDSTALKPVARVHGKDPGPGSPMSFIILSDEEVDEIAATPTAHKRQSRARSVDSISIVESSPEEVLEDERRRKRDKLARLHRTLGSRVPTHLILGFDGDENALPPLPSTNSPVMGPPRTDNPSDRSAWLRRRRSSSVAILPATWSDELDRSQETLNEEEKARNVRRAQKMEKMFGVAPPQKLYHTRHYSPCLPGASPLSSPVKSQHSELTSSGPSIASSQKSKSKHKDYGQRPGTSDSSQGLLRSGQNSIDGNTDVYNHYQHSLTQLNDIIDRADTQSLVELEEYLTKDQSPPPPTAMKEFIRSDRRLSNASTRSDRRHSLPASIATTITEDYPLVSPAPEISDFQLRRRKAAKLTKFFGEDYMILIAKVLGSLEKGVEEESKRGTLDADQAMDLRRKLRSLRTKRDRAY